MESASPDWTGACWDGSQQEFRATTKIIVTAKRVRAQKLVIIRLSPHGNNKQGNGSVVFLFSEPCKMSKCFVVLDEVGRNHMVNLSFIRVLWISDVFKMFS